jgi:hypothetical protein
LDVAVDVGVDGCPSDTGFSSRVVLEILLLLLQFRGDDMSFEKFADR